MGTPFGHRIGLFLLCVSLATGCASLGIGGEESDGASAGDGVQVRSVDGPSALVVGQQGRFSASYNGDAATPISFRWSMGDGTTRHGVSVDHVYQRADTFVVTVVAENPVEADSVSVRVRVEGSEERFGMSSEGVCVSLLSRAEAAYRSGRFEDALDEIDRCLLSRNAEEWERAQAFHLQALVYLARGDRDLARASTAKMLNLAPEFRPDPLLDPPPFVELVREIQR